MQPVVELQCLAPGRYAYRIRPPRKNGRIPPPSFHESGFESLAECVLHAARGLVPRFQRIYLRYQDFCVGEHDLAELTSESGRVARELVERYCVLTDLQTAETRLPLQPA